MDEIGLYWDELAASTGYFRTNSTLFVFAWTCLDIKTTGRLGYHFNVSTCFNCANLKTKKKKKKKKKRKWKDPFRINRSCLQ